MNTIDVINRILIVLGDIEIKARQSGQMEQILRDLISLKQSLEANEKE